MVAEPDLATFMKPKVSVLIITYNQEGYIAEAIESAVLQDYPNLEVVVSDDASTDRTPEIILDYSRRYPSRVVPVLNQTNRGLTGNSNAGLRACTGEYLAYMGGDDILLPGKISAQVDWFTEDPKRVLCGHQVEVFYDDNSRAPHPLPARLQFGHGAEPIIRNGAFGATSVMVRANKIPPHGFEERLPVVSDHMLWVDILAGGGGFGYIQGTYARYRRHDANVTNDPFRTALDVKEYLNIVANRYPQYRRACDYAYVRRILYDLGVVLLRAGRKGEARAKFMGAVRREPWFLKAWVRAAQCLI